jgi:hypothetical protein
MFLGSNNIELPEAAFISTEFKKITMLIFINKIMFRIYSLIFGSDLPRVLEEMKSSLQPSLENMMGDSMFFTQSTVIWGMPRRTSPFTGFYDSQDIFFGIYKTKGHLRD